MWAMSPGELYVPSLLKTMWPDAGSSVPSRWEASEA